MAFVDVSVDPTLARFVLDELNANVAVEIAPTWPNLINDIDLSFESLDDHANYDAGDVEMVIWQSKDRSSVVAYTIHTRFDGWSFLLLSVLFALLSLLVIEVVVVLDAPQRAFLFKAIRGGKSEWLSAFHSIYHPVTITFQPHQSICLIRGKRVEFPTTPFLYYLWYAKRRIEGTQQGWFLNPAQDKNDLEAAVSLIALMEQYGGHARAINELKSKGITAKTLDQNRNKIKDSLERALPAELLDAFCFESKRDLKSGRYWHRLAIEPEGINIDLG
jgi:hypothetical protein